MTHEYPSHHYLTTCIVQWKYFQGLEIASMQAEVLCIIRIII